MTSALAQSRGEDTTAALTGLRALVVHEWLYAWAGAERCLEQILALFPQADLLVGVAAPEFVGHNDVTRRARESWVGKLPGARRHRRWFLPLHALAFALEDTRGYDLVISSSHAFEKFIRARGGAKHVCYCYSPPRYLWDMSAEHLALANLPQKVALGVSLPALRWLDRRAARGVDRFVSISRHVASRVRRAYGVESAVVYPPVSPKPLPPGGVPPRSGDPYLLYLGRLVEYKRVDLLVRAAELVGMRLIVAGDGPERPKLERIAGPHTEFRGAVSEEEAGVLLENCEAFVFAGEEDFGISLVEANAHGRPVVCYRRGGGAETMVHGETAIMFERQDERALAEAIQACLASAWDGILLKANAARFRPERFREELLRDVLVHVSATPPRGCYW